MTHAISRVANILNLGYQTEIRYRACPKVEGFPFYASPELIAGREEVFASIIEATYWFAAIEAYRYLSMQVPDDVLETSEVVDWIDIYRIANAKLYHRESNIREVLERSGLSDSTIYMLEDIVDYIHNTENGKKINKSSNGAFDLGLLFYRGIIDNVSAFLIGHEIFHYNGNKDIIHSQSNVEVSGFFNEMIGLQQPKKLLDPFLVKVDKNEIRADRSGLRVLEKVDRVNSEIRKKSIASAIIRKATINLLAGPLISGFDIYRIASEVKPQCIIIESYMYPEIRLLLVASVMHHNESKYSWAVRMCDNTAKAFVTVIQKHVSESKDSDGNIPDSILELLPDGVLVGWETNNWDENSFRCFKK